jgi:hypothetical protein
MIHFAAMGNCVDRIKESLNIDKYIHVEDNRGWTALHWAAYFGHTEAVTTLIRDGASLSCRDKYGWTPYHLSVFSGSQHIEELVRGDQDMLDETFPEAEKEIRAFCSSCGRVSVSCSQTKHHYEFLASEHR